MLVSAWLMNGSSSRSSNSLGGLITLKYFETPITYKLIKELPKVLVILAPSLASKRQYSLSTSCGVIRSMSESCNSRPKYCRLPPPAIMAEILSLFDSCCRSCFSSGVSSEISFNRSSAFIFIFWKIYFNLKKMKKFKHPTEILTEAEAIVISSSIIFALSIIIFYFKHFYFCAIFSFKHCYVCF